jgi:hypothetical protein
MTACFTLLNADYFSNLVTQINESGTEAQLQTLVTKVYGDLSMLVSTMTGQIGLLAPLLTAPTDLPSVITWITSLIESFAKPSANLALSLAAITTQVATLTAAIEAVATARGWSITVPSVGVICTI